MSIEISTKEYVDYLEIVFNRIHGEKEYVTSLDSELGDGDHWINMNMGLEALVAKKEKLESLSPKNMLKEIGMTMMSVIGGSSGVLYGSAYINAAKNLKDIEKLELNDIYDILQNQLIGMKERGQAEAGDKTMIDPLNEALLAFEKARNENMSENDTLSCVQMGAKYGMEATKDMQAKKGRGRYREDKGVGCIDAGAVTMYYQIDELAKFLKTKIK